MTLRAFVREGVVPRSQAGRRLALAALVDSAGTGMFLTVSAVYFTRQVGLAPAQVGVGLSVAAVAGLLASVPIGALGDRFGPGRVYVALQLWRGLGYAAYTLVSGFPGFVAVASIIEVGDAALPAIAQAVVGLAVPREERIETLARVRALRNAGFGLGAALATAVLAVGSRQAFLALVLGTAGAVILGAALLSRAGLARLRDLPVVAPRFGFASNPPLLAAALLNGVLCIHVTLLFVALPLWIANHTRVPVVLVGPLVALNTVMAVALQARFSVRAGRLGGAVDCMARAGFALAGFGVLALLMGQIQIVGIAAPLAVLATVLLTCGELWQSAGGWQISYALARRDRQVEYLATFQLGTGLQAIVGPAVVVGMIFPSELGWLCFALVMAGAGLLVRPAVRAAGSEVGL
ncbi:MAG: MFS transporter [Candidatus Nephthysia bennettiae]|uniref:MFS transporter n=1 Tax=Candidatus Nephthysia bennettiae TaxID=3127016 RepID=A0A934K086_9BACT|nr:MFS transporter [Candidatus Dormibacteraeota bacterium]MBJ7610780.1 MFS transporter [Candidatus Dormibacteraeota bacterium]PZR87458.1 MAG: MFS transporter [Candidatus Dormibacteraeota bacterium]